MHPLGAPIAISLDTFVHTATQVAFQLLLTQHYTSVLSRRLCKLVFSSDNHILLTAAAIKSDVHDARNRSKISDREKINKLHLNNLIT